MGGSILFFAFLALATAGHGHGHGGHGHGHHGGGGHQHGDGDCHDGSLQNKRRACPDGYFYAGEIEPESEKPQTRDMVVEKGECSQVYSCYAFRAWNTSWTNATKQCSDIEGAPGELLSVNNIEESQILTSELFLTGAFGSGNLPQTTFTSGISLAPEVWTWFGAGKEEDSEVNKTIVDSMTSNNNNNNNTVGY